MGSPGIRPADAIVVGAGPNGLAAAVILARAGLAVHVIEGASTPGGGCRTQELTLPGFRHDVCSAVHPLAAASPFFQTIDLAALGATLRTPKVAFAHPLDGGRAAYVAGSVEETAAGLGADGRAYRRLFGPLVRDLPYTLPEILVPMFRSVPGHPVALARFELDGILPVSLLARRFRTEETRGLLAGVAAHAMLPLTAPATAGYGLMLMMIAHGVGWPLVEGGSARLIDALVAELTSLGGQVETGRWVSSLDSLPPARAVLLDVTPRQLAAIAGELPGWQGRALARFKYGPGVCKVDWALSGPVPWEAAPCREAGTVHLGGTLAEVARSEAEVNKGRHPGRPYCLVAQPGVVDPTRAPAGQHTLWGYCHVPEGSDVDMSGRIEAQIERFAPGFRDLILARSVKTAVDMERYNPNYVGGNINAGIGSLLQTVFRPTPRWNPYRTPLPRVYLCSASTPPGGGVHGMCGDGAARAVLADLGVKAPR